MARTRWPPDWEPWPLAQARQHRDGTAVTLARLELNTAYPCGVTGEIYQEDSQRSRLITGLLGGHGPACLVGARVHRVSSRPPPCPRSHSAR